MTTLNDVYTRMVDVLRAEGIKRVSRIGETVTDPPAVVVGIPEMLWGSSNDHEPTEFTWPVAVVVPVTDKAPVELFDLVPKVGAALDTIPEVTVIRALPGVWNDGGTPLPSYEITCEVNL